MHQRTISMTSLDWVLTVFGSHWVDHWKLSFSYCDLFWSKMSIFAAAKLVAYSTELALVSIKKPIFIQPSLSKGCFGSWASLIVDLRAVTSNFCTLVCKYTSLFMVDIDPIPSNYHSSFHSNTAIIENLDPIPAILPHECLDEVVAVITRSVNMSITSEIFPSL